MKSMSQPKRQKFLMQLRPSIFTILTAQRTCRLGHGVVWTILSTVSLPRRFLTKLPKPLAKILINCAVSCLPVKPRHLKVLDLAAEKAGWGEPIAQGKGRGISLQESFGSLVAQVVDVTLTGGKIGVDRVVCAIDAGFAVSPDGLTAQMESGIIYGLSAAMYGEVSVVNGAVQQTAFHDYPVTRMQDSPVIETHILNSGEAMGGAGEPGTPGIAPALANAIYQATGTRVRKLPVSQYDFNYRIEETEELG